LAPTPQMLALASACFSAVSTTLIQKGLRRSNFYAGFWINVVVGMLGLWTVVLLVVPRTEYHWRAVPYFILSGVVGTAGGRLFRVVAIEKVGAPVAAAINNLSPFIATGLAILCLGERVTVPILLGTLVIVLGTILLSLSGKQGGFRVRHLLYPLLSASCFGVVAIIRKMGLGHAGPLFDSAVNITAAMVAATTFVRVSGKRGALVCDRRRCPFRKSLVSFLLDKGRNLTSFISQITVLCNYVPPLLWLMCRNNPNRGGTDRHEMHETA